MKLVPMEMSKKERKQSNMCVPDGGTQGEGPRYPYGLELSLEKESIKKLGIDFKNVSVGDEVEISCIGKVTRISTNERSGGEADKSMSIQITDMAVNAGDELDWDTSESKATEILKKREM